MHTPSADPVDLTTRPWFQALPDLQERLASFGRVVVRVPEPAAAGDRWRGEAGPAGRPHLGLRDWLDLAEAVGARIASVTPTTQDDVPHLDLEFVRLGAESDLHGSASETRDDPRSEGRDHVRYGPDGAFSRVRKALLPGFRLPLDEAIAFAVGPTGRAVDRVLVLGCHRGDELEVLAASDAAITPDRVVGVDRERAALDEARGRFPSATFVNADVATLAQAPLPDLGRFDLILVVALLQSPSLDGPAVLRGLVRHHATEHGGLVVGLPASRFRDGEIVWGARTRNYAETDLSLVVRDLAGHRRYLHQHGYRTRIGGRYDLLLAAYR